MSGENRTLTAVPGLRVGHATDSGGRSGCTVVLGPFRAAADVRGSATGTRELDVLEPRHVVPEANAILLTGGSAFGLAAAEGVMAWLEERGIGFETRTGVVPIVPSAVLYDLREGVPRPDAVTGRAACDAATAGPVERGRVGAGAGATVGKVGGPEGASEGGVGSAAAPYREWTVGALAVVNAVGDVVDRDGRIVAGARAEDGTFLDTARLLREEGLEGGFAGRRSPGAGESTTLGVVATDAPLARVELQRVARTAVGGMARRIVPAFTSFDGDVCFALSTGGLSSAGGAGGRPSAREGEGLTSAEILAIGSVAAGLLADAVVDAVRR